jgi:hypothetical protein
MVLRTAYLVILLLLASGSGASATDTDSLFVSHSDAIKTLLRNELGAGDLRARTSIDGIEYFIFESSDPLTNGTWVALTRGKGRTEYFDFLILVSPDRNIRLIKILKYRSEYGFEITGKNWLNQFYKKGAESFVYGSSIDAISGATLSGKSLTDRVNAIMIYLRSLPGSRG